MAQPVRRILFCYLALLSAATIFAIFRFDANVSGAFEIRRDGLANCWVGTCAVPFVAFAVALCGVHLASKRVVRYGYLRAIRMSIGLCTIGIVLIGCSTPPWVTLPGALFVSLGVGGTYGTAIAFAWASISQRWRGVACGIVFSATSVSRSIFMFVVPYFSSGNSFLLVGLVLVVMALLFSLFVDDEELPERERPKESKREWSSLWAAILIWVGLSVVSSMYIWRMPIITGQLPDALMKIEVYGSGLLSAMAMVFGAWLAVFIRRTILVTGFYLAVVTVILLGKHLRLDMYSMLALAHSEGFARDGFLGVLVSTIPGWFSDSRRAVLFGVTVLSAKTVAALVEGAVVCLNVDSNGKLTPVSPWWLVIALVSAAGLLLFEARCRESEACQVPL